MTDTPKMNYTKRPWCSWHDRQYKPEIKVLLFILYFNRIIIKTNTTSSSKPPTGHGGWKKMKE